MKRCINIFFYLILAALTISVVLFAVSSYRNRTDTEHISGIGTFKLMHMITGSMNPTINVDDIIITKTVDTENLKPGDIITFRTSANILVTHRIMDIKEDGRFITKGDANAEEDTSLIVNKDNIIGKYIFRIPKGAYVIEFIQSSAGLVLLVLLMIGAFEVRKVERGFVH